jgi:hypothetical protein
VRQKRASILLCPRFNWQNGSKPKYSKQNQFCPILHVPLPDEAPSTLSNWLGILQAGYEAGRFALGRHEGHPPSRSSDHVVKIVGGSRLQVLEADMLNALTNVRFWGQSGH